MPGARRVTLILDRIPHHGEHSGYHALVGQLRQSGVTDHVDLACLSRFADRRLDRLVAPAACPWYRWPTLFRELAAVRRLVRREPWLCHFLYGEGGYHYTGRLRQRLGSFPGKVVCTFHQPPELFEQVIGRDTNLGSIDAAVVLCSEQERHLRGRADAPQRVQVIPHSVDTTFFRPAPRPTASPRPYFLALGSHLRDFSLLDAVARRLCELEPRVDLIVVARGPAARALSLLPNVTLRAGITDDELLRTLQGAHGLVLPLLDASANNALMEGMACGLPVIVTDVGGVREYAAPDGAILVAPGDPDVVCDAIRRLLIDPSLGRRLGSAARDHALRLTPQRAATSLVTLYDELLSGG